MHVESMYVGLILYNICIIDIRGCMEMFCGNYIRLQKTLLI